MCSVHPSGPSGRAEEPEEPGLPRFGPHGAEHARRFGWRLVRRLCEVRGGGAEVGGLHDEAATALCGRGREKEGQQQGSRQETLTQMATPRHFGQALVSRTLHVSEPGPCSLFGCAAGGRTGEMTLDVTLHDVGGNESRRRSTWFAPCEPSMLLPMHVETEHCSLAPRLVQHQVNPLRPLSQRPLGTLADCLPAPSRLELCPDGALCALLRSRDVYDVEQSLAVAPYAPEKLKVLLGKIEALPEFNS